MELSDLRREIETAQETLNILQAQHIRLTGKRHVHELRISEEAKKQLEQDEKKHPEFRGKPTRESGYNMLADGRFEMGA